MTYLSYSEEKRRDLSHYKVVSGQIRNQTTIYSSINGLFNYFHHKEAFLPQYIHKTNNNRCDKVLPH